MPMTKTTISICAAFYDVGTYRHDATQVRIIIKKQVQARERSIIIKIIMSSHLYVCVIRTRVYAHTHRHIYTCVCINIVFIIFFFLFSRFCCCRGTSALFAESCNGHLRTCLRARKMLRPERLAAVSHERPGRRGMCGARSRCKRATCSARWPTTLHPSSLWTFFVFFPTSSSSSSCSCSS